MQVKTQSGRTFTFSDFETKNLRDFEKEFIQLFEIRKGKKFTKLSGEERDIEIKNSRAFDLEQAKEIRFKLFILIGLCLFLSGLFIKNYIENKAGTAAPLIFLPIGSAGILFLLFHKLRRVNRIIRTDV